MKITRRQIRKIIKEHQADQQADKLLNEGFLDFLKKMGEAMIDAYKKQQGITDDLEKDLTSQIGKLGVDGLDGSVKSLASNYITDAKNSRKELLKKVMADMKKMEGVEEKDAQKLAVSVLSYAWSAAGSGQ